jgi:5-methylthioadenosine/S-adenosylhomocysteine deaminase
VDLIIDGGTVVTMGSKGIIRNGAVVVENGCIVDVGKSVQLKRKHSGYEKINAEGKVVIPGLINTHQHAAMSLLRGYADDYPLNEWLKNWIWPLEKQMTGQDIYVGALLTALESILGGTTTINTMYHYMNNDNEAKALAESGLRGVVGHVCFSWRKEHDLKALKALAQNWHGKANGHIRVSVDPHAAYTVDPEYMRELRETAQELNIKHGKSNQPIIWHIHAAETSNEPEKIRKAFNVQVKGGVFEYLDSLNVLGNDIVTAHCVHLTKRDIEVMTRKGVKVAHNPISNLKLGSGASPVPELLQAGATVSLGTDSACSNNSSDMFEVMKVIALSHKGVKLNPTILHAEQVLRMATLEGARALLWNREIGSIEVGKDADLAIVDFKKPHLRPVFSEISHLVYSAKSSDVDTVLVKGRIIMENRKVTTLNVDHVLESAEKAKNRLLSKLQSYVSKTRVDLLDANLRFFSS